MLRNKQRLLFLSSILAIITGILVQCICNYYQEKDRVNLVVAILSSRYNFDQRDVIRKTWLNHSTSHDLKWVPFFVVGNEDCHVPVSDRVSPFSCERINITKSDLQFASVASTFKTRRLKNRDCNPVVGLSFQVNSDIVLTRVGCVFIRGKACKDIQLTDVMSRKTIIKEEMNGNNNNNNNEKEKNEVDEAGVSSLTLNTSLLLPKGFTGLIISHYYEDEDLCSDLSLDLNDSNNTGLVSLLKVYRHEPVLDDYLAEKFHRNRHDLYLIYFGFKVADEMTTAEFLRKYPERQKQWLEENMERSQRLDKEIKEHKDIVVVDNLDVYRNLPQKILKFLQWTTTSFNFDYILKTDDDCFIDIELVLESLAKNTVDRNYWWGNFRRLWPVDQYGKWREYDYESVTYPPFSCGSGYVLDKSLVDFIVDNKKRLHTFQGEDVSVGIWLSPLKLTRHQDDRWLCSKKDVKEGSHFISVPDIQTYEMSKLNEWKMLSKSKP